MLLTALAFLHATHAFMGVKGPQVPQPKGNWRQFLFSADAVQTQPTCSPSALTRRTFATIASGVLACSQTQALHATDYRPYVPPTASINFLVPILEVKLQLDAMAPLVDDPSSWATIQSRLQAAPFTDRKLPGTDVNGRGNARRSIPVVGNLFRQTIKQYESNLQYSYDSESEAIVGDLDFRDLIRNTILTQLQDLEAQAGFMSKLTAEDVRLTDVEELRELMDGARSTMGQYLSRIPKGDVVSAEQMARKNL